MPTYASVEALPDEATNDEGRPFLDLFASTATADPAMAPGHVIAGMRIFRVGSFKNSDGESTKWTSADLHQMVENFNALKDDGTFPHVPVRENHGRDVRSVVGYFTALRVEGKFLVADLEITEPTAADRYTRGTYRARSLEVGTYETNKGVAYYPTVMGLAFCDIPAVEGLYAAAVASYSKGEVRSFGATVAGPGKTRPAPAAPAAPAPADPNVTDPEFVTPQEGLKDVLIDLHELKDLLAGDPDSEATLQRIVDAVTAFNDDLNTPGDASDDATSGGNGKTAGNASTAPSDKNRAYASPEALVKFTLAGTTIEVDEAVQPALDAFAAAYAGLETANQNLATENEALKKDAETAAFSARDAKVDGWLAAKKITPAEVEPQKAFCRSLSDEQFAAHASLKEQAQTLAFAAGVATGKPDEPAADDQQKEISKHNATLRMMSLAGVQGDAYTNSKPFKALVALGVTPEGK